MSVFGLFYPENPYNDVFFHMKWASDIEIGKFLKGRGGRQRVIVGRVMRDNQKLA